MDERALVSTSWLAERLEEPGLRVLDGSWYLSSEGRDPRAEFANEHIPGARFFDIDEIADRATDLPHMLPPPIQFAEAVGAMGIGNEHQVVVYDGAGLFSAARVWWTFRVFGHDRVAVLDGGFPKWKREGRPVTAEAAPVTPVSFEARLRSDLVRSLGQMQANLHTRAEQVLDARGRDRFRGELPEPRAGCRSGHMPGSKNLPYAELLAEDGTMRSREALERAFTEAGISLDQPVTSSCGSGVTASILALGLFLLGRESVPVYDGSWSEWGSRNDTPVEKT